jgi:hypothetical protein
MNDFDGFKKTGLDSEIEAQIDDHCKKYNLSEVDALKLFPVLARRQHLKRFLAHTEFFKMTLDVPGDIAELGVFRGLGLMTWANLLECYCIGDRTKRVFGFDNWSGFKKLDREDGREDVTVQKFTGGFSPSSYKEELSNAIDIFDRDRFIPWKKRVILIEGDIEESVPHFVKENEGVRFSLVHFDCDLYAPTKSALNALWPRLSRGGIFLFDEYAIPEWPGETLAVDEFLSDKPDVKIKTLQWTNAPAGYLVKK